MVEIIEMKGGDFDRCVLSGCQEPQGMRGKRRGEEESVVDLKSMKRFLNRLSIEIEKNVVSFFRILMLSVGTGQRALVDVKRPLVEKDKSPSIDRERERKRTRRGGRRILKGKESKVMRTMHPSTFDAQQSINSHIACC